MPVNKDRVLKIVRLCLRLDTLAVQVYRELAGHTEDAELRDFWFTMQHDEEVHVGYWVSLLHLGENFTLPDVFDDADRVVTELEDLAARGGEWLAQSRSPDLTTNDALILTYRMEFYMLHPALETLFYTLGVSLETPSPEVQYDAHIQRLTDVFAKHAKGGSPALELLGEALLHLWRGSKALARQAANDSLTQLLNRRGFLNIVEPLAYFSQRKGFNVGVLMVDLDRFKDINDKHGHPTGDMVLRAVARCISSTVRTSDIVGRFGGEEFAVFLPEIQPDVLGMVAEKVRRCIENLHPGGLHVTGSIGLAEGTIVGAPLTGLQALIDKADARLYQAKEQGRNRVVGGAG